MRIRASGAHRRLDNDSTKIEGFLVFIKERERVLTIGPAQEDWTLILPRKKEYSKSALIKEAW